MPEGSYWLAAAGIITSVVMTLLGNRIADRWKARDTKREAATVGEAATLREREGRAWTVIEEDNKRKETLIARLAAEADEDQVTMDRLRVERNQALTAAADWEIAARKSAAYLSRIEELESRIEHERAEHAMDMRTLKAEIKRLKGH